MLLEKQGVGNNIWVGDKCQSNSGVLKPLLELELGLIPAFSQALILVQNVPMSVTNTIYFMRMFQIF